MIFIHVTREPERQSLTHRGRKGNIKYLTKMTKLKTVKTDRSKAVLSGLKCDSIYDCCPAAHTSRLPVSCCWSNENSNLSFSVREGKSYDPGSPFPLLCPCAGGLACSLHIKPLFTSTQLLFGSAYNPAPRRQRILLRFNTC